MSYSSSWDKKPTVDVYPYRVNEGRVCHNCVAGFPTSSFGVCSGLCLMCTEINSQRPVSPPRRFPASEGARCVKCKVVQIKNSNFGIYRSTCKICDPLIVPLIQRCIACDTYKKFCWNNVCRGCRVGKYFCENVGDFFASEKEHWELCYCLPYDDRCKRREKRKEREINVSRTVISQPSGEYVNNGEANTPSTSSAATQ